MGNLTLGLRGLLCVILVGFMSQLAGCCTKCDLKKKCCAPETPPIPAKPLQPPACRDDLWVGFSKDGCPAPAAAFANEWKVEEPFRGFMFDGVDVLDDPMTVTILEQSRTSTQTFQSSEELLKVLRGLCLYRAQSATPNPASLPAGGDAWLDPDCVARPLAGPGPAANAARSAITQGMRGSYDVAVGRRDLINADKAFKGRAMPVEAIVVDTASDDVDVARHGHIVGQVISEIACPKGEDKQADPGGSRCERLFKQRVTFRAGLLEGHPSGQSGHYGSQSDLAQVLTEVAKGVASTPPEERRPTVVNLSVGWDGRPPTSTTTASKNGADAVKIAVRALRAAGALIFASAGNHGGPKSHGPMYPAAWESEMVRIDGKEQPLLYAVGAVDAESRWLGNARIAAVPMLNAPGANFVWGHDARQRTTATVPKPAIPKNAVEVRSGTSIATAVLTGTAVRYWSEHHKATADEVVQALFKTSLTMTHGTVDFGSSSWPTPSGAKRARIVRPPQLSSAGAAIPPAPIVFNQAILNSVTVPAEVSTRPNCKPVQACGAEAYFSLGCCRGARDERLCHVDYYCAEEQHPGRYGREVVTPHPDDPICSVCTLAESSGELYVELDVLEYSYQATEPKLTIEYDGQHRVIYDLVSEGLPDTMDPGEVQQVVIGLESGSTVTKAGISFLVTPTDGSGEPYSTLEHLPVN